MSAAHAPAAVAAPQRIWCLTVHDHHNDETLRGLFRASTEAAALKFVQKEVIAAAEHVVASLAPNAQYVRAPRMQTPLASDLWHALLLAQAEKELQEDRRARRKRGELANPHDVTDLMKAGREVEGRLGDRFNERSAVHTAELQADLAWLRALTVAQFGELLKRGPHTYPNDYSINTDFTWAEHEEEQIANADGEDNEDED